MNQHVISLCRVATADFRQVVYGLQKNNRIAGRKRPASGSNAATRQSNAKTMTPIPLDQLGFGWRSLQIRHVVAGVALSAAHRCSAGMGANAQMDSDKSRPSAVLA
ncbi:MAG: hypothetical protein U0X75_07285 [Acidobacteriota bacterium]